MGIARDTYRAALALAVGVLLLEASGLRRPAPPQHQAMPAVHWPAPPQTVVFQQSQPDRPLRRVAAAVMEFGDSMIGVFR